MSRGQISLEALTAFATYIVILAIFISLANSMAGQAAKARERMALRMDLEGKATALNYLAVDGQYAYIPDFIPNLQGRNVSCKDNIIQISNTSITTKTVANFTGSQWDCNATHAFAEPV